MGIEEDIRNMTERLVIIETKLDFILNNQKSVQAILWTEKQKDKKVKDTLMG